MRLRSCMGSLCSSGRGGHPLEQDSSTRRTKRQSLVTGLVRFFYSVVLTALALALWVILILGPGEAADPNDPHGFSVWTLLTLAPFVTIILGAAVSLRSTYRWASWRWIPPLAITANGVTWLALVERPKAGGGLPDPVFWAFEAMPLDLRSGLLWLRRLKRSDRNNRRMPPSSGLSTIAGTWS